MIQRQVLALSGIGIALLVAASANATDGAFVSEAQVKAVEPIVERHHIPPRCQAAREPTAAGLAEWLRFDLGLAPPECSQARTKEVTRGYRVTLIWEGREIIEVMDDHPGTHVPISVSLQ